MRALSSPLRRQMEAAVLAARREAETAVRSSFDGLGVFSDRRPDHLDDGQARLRNGLRAKWRQHGGGDEARPLLVAECAYEQWHRLLFARFLAENALLLHPELEVPVSLADCEELAPELGEPDGWSVAARFAAEILPGIFRLEDPCVVLRLAPEGRTALERILDGLSDEVFQADDSLGWVYQFWQNDQKDAVNASERKIGGADLGPVTQLFTENYMVRFLLENSLGAWWAARHPESPLVAHYDYLRLDDEGRPAAGLFDGWPERVAEVTVMDPCCGSGHFLVEAFSMLWQMRAEEEGLAPIEAQDAVLRDNLFGLELDPRCVQIAMFAVALQTWKAGGGWRPLPVPSVACTGIPVKAAVSEWKALADGDQRLESALVRLHDLYRNAGTLGSLIDPQRAAAGPGRSHQSSFDDISWVEVEEGLLRLLECENDGDPATSILRLDISGVAKAANLSSATYTLLATNPPFLGRPHQSSILMEFCDAFYSYSRHDLAYSMLSRALGMSDGSIAFVSPQAWLFQPRSEQMRAQLLRTRSIGVIAWLGAGAFESISGEVVKPALVVIGAAPPRIESTHGAIVIDHLSGTEAKARELREGNWNFVEQRKQLENASHRILPHALTSELLSQFARSHQGIKTGDNPRFARAFWELRDIGQGWRRIVTAPSRSTAYGGRSYVSFWEDGRGAMSEITQAGATFRGKAAWEQQGVVVSVMGKIYATLYNGELFDGQVITPHSENDLAALWSFVSSPEFSDGLKTVDKNLAANTSALQSVPVEFSRWRALAEAAGPLPEPWSDDPTQWLFKGRPEVSTSPLHVAVARLLGYRWPAQADDALNDLADRDGIVCLPSVAGEDPAADRVLSILARSYGDEWSTARLTALLQESGSKKRNLADWLQDDFFKQHCALFGQRPFIWHIGDGQRDGFSALVNYHRLDRAMLQKLTHTYLGVDWVGRQRAGVASQVPGAEGRLAVALDLQTRLEAILQGEAPLDIFVRWKGTEEQPAGWDPDLGDGVRLNIRPFIHADVLRSKVKVHWKQDRGKDPDGAERINDIHLSLAEKRDARSRARRP